MARLILSLFDHSGEWSRPYLEAGYRVERIDIQDGRDIMAFDWRQFGPIHGILAAPPVLILQIRGRDGSPGKTQTAKQR